MQSASPYEHRPAQLHADAAIPPLTTLSHAISGLKMHILPACWGLSSPLSPSHTLRRRTGTESTPYMDEKAHARVACPRPRMKSDLIIRNATGCRDRTWPFPLLVRETLEGGSYAGFVHVGGRGYRLRVCGVGGKISVEMEGSLYQLLANDEAMLRLRMSQNDDVGYAPHLHPPSLENPHTFFLLIFEVADIRVQLLSLSPSLSNGVKLGFCRHSKARCRRGRRQCQPGVWLRQVLIVEGLGLRFYRFDEGLGFRV
jgi:hypothetical protein